ncbi:hypothetical protein FRB94_006666 [Tulasnella sp. JGI-2019a]|nr:hypothetical protein FRB93_006435 [Tulasnella sp. JGI-2019a]KAG8998776.1 hypothetical protein FRB94_006666 [Tulasnella sp. JGI-2019a]
MATSATFTFGDRLGLVFIVQSACLSMIAVSALLGYALYNSIRNSKRPPSATGRPAWHFLRSPVDYYFLSLMVADLVQSIANLLHIRWIRDAGLTEGTYCTTQGAMKQVGDVGVALATLVIAGHTFLVLVYRWKAPTSPVFPLFVVGCIWVFIILITTIPSSLEKNPAYYGETTYWCWIRPEYRAEQIGLEYGIFWFVAVVGLLLYLPVFFCLRGNLIVNFDTPPDGRTKGKMHLEWNWQSHARARRVGDRDRDTQKQMRVSRQMLAYPLAYIVLIGPLSVTRWLQFTDKSKLPAAAVSFSGLLFASSGLVNVILYLISRPAVLRSLRKDKRAVATGRTIGPMPEATMMSGSYVTTTDAAHTFSSPSVPAPVPAINVEGQQYMLSDDDDTGDEDDYDYEDRRPQRFAMSPFDDMGHRRLETDQTLAVPTSATGLVREKEWPSALASSPGASGSHGHESWKGSQGGSPSGSWISKK